MIKQELQLNEKKLTFDNVNQALKKALVWILAQKSNYLSIDLSNISFIDSAGVAMLVELKRITHVEYQKNLVLKFSNQIVQMIEFYELEGLLENIDEY
jgi:ABC-type transporter Mla MlaB component